MLNLIPFVQLLVFLYHLCVRYCNLDQKKKLIEDSSNPYPLIKPSSLEDLASAEEGVVCQGWGYTVLVVLQPWHQDFI